MRTQARRQEAKIAALEEAVSEGHVAIEIAKAGAAAVRAEASMAAGVAGAAGAAGSAGAAGRRGGRERLPSTMECPLPDDEQAAAAAAAASAAVAASAGRGAGNGKGGLPPRCGRRRRATPLRRSEEEAEWG